MGKRRGCSSNAVLFISLLGVAERAKCEVKKTSRALVNLCFATILETSYSRLVPVIYGVSDGLW